MFQFLLFFFIMIMVALAFWSISEGRAFASLDGDLNRGVRVWAQPLSMELRQFLENLDKSIHLANKSIRKVGHEVLVTEERPQWRRRSWYYLAYINLSAQQGLLEFRMPLSSLVSSVASLFFIPLIIFALLLQSDGVDQQTSLLSFAVFILIASIISLLWQHFRERSRILKILNEAMAGQGLV